MWTIDPKIPISLWWALAAAALTAIVWYSFRRDWSVSRLRRVGLTLLLALGFVGPLLIALNPTYVEAVPPMPGNPMLTVLVDGTMSMKTEDVGTERPISRWQSAVAIAAQVKQSDSSIDVRRLAFGDLVQPYVDPLTPSNSNNGNNTANELWPQGHRSDLGTALRQTARTGSPLGHAILMITDGAHNVGAVESLLQSAREANALATPVYTVTLGTSVGMKNMSLTAKSPRMIAFPKRPVAIRAMVGHNGLAGQTTKIFLMIDERVLMTQTVRLNSDPVQEVRFLLEQGVQDPVERYRIVASDIPGEATTVDNQTTVLVQRLNAPIGVLILEGKPYWDSKFLARNMAQDPVVDLTSIVRLATGRFLQRKITRQAMGIDETETSKRALSDEKPIEPTNDQWLVEKELASPLESMELLAEYRLLILGRDSGPFLTDQAIENLRSWISQSGGCLLCARGAPTDQVVAKLAEILPVRWSPASESRIRAKVSQHGIDSSVFDTLLADGTDPLGALPSLAVGAIPKERPGLPQVLMQSPANESGVNVPIVTYQPFGSGQTIVVEGAGMWRWAFLAPKHAEKDKIYPTLWQSMVQWIISQQDMMPGQEIAIRSDRATFLSGDRAGASVIVKNPGKWEVKGGQSGLSVLMQAASDELPKRFSLSPSGLENGMFRVDLQNLDVGYYTLRVVSGEKDQVHAATAFEVRDPWFESLEVDARPDIMKQVARLSGGEVLEPDQVAGLVQRFEERLKQQQKHEEIRSTLWDRPIVLVAILIGWVSTWIVRRQSGLV